MHARFISWLYITDINECRSNNSCDINAECINTNGGFNCVCKTGFNGTGQFCEGKVLYAPHQPIFTSLYMQILMSALENIIVATVQILMEAMSASVLVHLLVMEISVTMKVKVSS